MYGHSSTRLFFNIIQRGAASYDRIREIESVPSGIVTTYQNSDAPTGDINFNLKQFQFEDTAHASLHDINFTIQQGMTVGIVGHTGAGKSLLIRLLLREFDTERPEDIQYGHHPLRDYDIRKLRAQFGYVPQEHFYFLQRFEGTLRLVNPILMMKRSIMPAR